MIETIEKIAKHKWLADQLLLMRILGHEPVKQQLPGDVACPIAWLA
jgi:hypothetical protein